jgi:hypothetical protein
MIKGGRSIYRYWLCANRESLLVNLLESKYSDAGIQNILDEQTNGSTNTKIEMYQPGGCAKGKREQR